MLMVLMLLLVMMVVVALVSVVVDGVGTRGRDEGGREGGRVVDEEGLVGGFRGTKTQGRDARVDLHATEFLVRVEKGPAEQEFETIGMRLDFGGEHVIEEELDKARGSSDGRTVSKATRGAVSIGDRDDDSVLKDDRVIGVCEFSGVVDRGRFRDDATCSVDGPDAQETTAAAVWHLALHRDEAHHLLARVEGGGDGTVAKEVLGRGVPLEEHPSD